MYAPQHRISTKYEGRKLRQIVSTKSPKCIVDKKRAPFLGQPLLDLLDVSRHVLVQILGYPGHNNPQRLKSEAVAPLLFWSVKAFHLPFDIVAPVGRYWAVRATGVMGGSVICNSSQQSF